MRRATHLRTHHTVHPHVCTNPSLLARAPAQKPVFSVRRNQQCGRLLAKCTLRCCLRSQTQFPLLEELLCVRVQVLGIFYFFSASTSEELFYRWKINDYWAENLLTRFLRLWIICLGFCLIWQSVIKKTDIWANTSCSMLQSLFESGYILKS